MSATTTPLAAVGTPATINAYFAILLWYATGNDMVALTRVPGAVQTAVSPVAGKPTLASLASNFSALTTDPAAFEAMVAKLEAAIQTGVSSNQYYVQDPAADPGAAPTAAGQINYGAALSVVGELFTTLRTTNTFGLSPEDDYNPTDPTCCQDQVMAVTQAPAIASAAVRARAAGTPPATT